MSDQQSDAQSRAQQRAAELVTFAATNFKLKLDYSEESIARVEQTLAGIHKHFGNNVDKNKAAVVNLANGFGSYIGEVVRRKHGGEWRANLPNLPAGVDGLCVNGSVLSPLQAVFLRITKGSQFSIENFYTKAVSTILQGRKPGGSTPAPPADPAADWVKSAAEAVADTKQLFGIELDYSEESLDRLDDALRRLHDVLTDKAPESQRMNDTEKFMLKPVAALRYVAYLGEVFRKALGAEWRNNLPACRPEAVDLVHQGELIRVRVRGKTVSPREIIVNCINDPQSWSAKNYYLDFKRTVQVNSAMDKAESFDDKMAVCALDAVTIARDRYGVTLDFSEASVSNLEGLLSKVHEQLPKAGDPNRPSDEWIAGISITFGVYLGEIFRKNLGGKWMPQNPHVPGSLPALNIHSTMLTPCRKVSLRILHGPGDNVEFFYKVSSKFIREGLPSSKS